MANQSDSSSSHDWVTIKDERAGLQADFPHHPLEVTFDVPFKNTPPKGKIHLYSLPLEKGLLALCTYQAFDHPFHLSNKEEFHHFFESVLVPHLFFNPQVFHNQQKLTYTTQNLKGEEAAHFCYYYQDRGITKRLEGMAIIKDGALYLYFYLASEKDFDKETLNRFLNSIQFS